MLPRALLIAVASVVLWAPVASAQAPTRSPDAPVRVYGLELERLADRERILIFAEKPLRYELEVPGPGRLLLRLHETVLDPSAPTRVLPPVEGKVRELRASEHLATGEPQVWVEIDHRSEQQAQVSQRGAMVAVDFPVPHLGRSKSFRLLFEDAEIADVVEGIAVATGTRFILDDRLQGRVTLAVSDRVNESEALELLDAALYLKGFIAVPAPGGYRKIVPVDQLAARAPFGPGAPRAGGEGPVLTLVRLERIDPQAVIGVLADALGATGLALPIDATRSVLIAGTEGQVRRWVFLAQALDRASDEVLRLIRIRYRPADEVASLIEELFRPEAAADAEELEVWADSRSNTLIVRATPHRLDDIREWVKDLDQPREGEGNVEVIPVEYVDPDDLADLLLSLAAATTPPLVVAAGAEPAAEALASRQLSVAVHGPTHSLVVSAEPETLALVREVVAALDRRLPQVLVEASVTEVTVGDEFELGFDFSVTLGSPNSPNDGFARISSTTSGGLAEPGVTDVDFAARLNHDQVMIPILDDNGNVTQVLEIPLQQMAITADSTNVGSRRVMQPTFIAASGEEQEFFAGSNIPVPRAAESDGSNPLQVTSAIDREDVGVRLRVRPTLGEEGGITLETDLELTQVDQKLTQALLGAPRPSVPLPGVTQPGVEQIGVSLGQRRVSTLVRLRDGEYAVIGFLVEKVEMESATGVKLLRDIPVLGRLFETKRSEKFKRYFMVALRASILRDAADNLAASLRMRLAFERSLARVNDLRRGDAAAYAVLVTTRPRLEEVTALAEALSLPSSERIEITHWEWAGKERYDLYVTGFPSISKAVEAANRLADAHPSELWQPQVVSIPTTEEIQRASAQAAGPAAGFESPRGSSTPSN